MVLLLAQKLLMVVGFSRLPEINNSDTTCKLQVFNFTKVDDATKLAETTQDAL